MKKVSTLKKIQLAMKTFVPPFFNHFSLRPNRKERVVMRVMRKKISIVGNAGIAKTKQKN